MNAKQSFKQVYALTRLNRNNIHFNRQLFRFDGGTIYIDGGILIICRNGRTVSDHPGFNVGAISGRLSKHGRRYFLATSQACGPVPLP